MPGFKNTFIKGMDKDTSKQKYSNSQYTHAENFRMLTDEGLSTGALENIKGNLELIDFSDTPSIWAFSGEDTFGLDDSLVEFTLSDGSVFTIEIDIDTTGEETANSFQTQLENNANLQDFTWSRAVNNRIVFYHNTLSISSISSPVFQEVVPSISDSKVIGSVDLRDSLILFTVSASLAEGPTHIWKLNYDITAPVPIGELKLLYAEYLNMSIETPIEAVSRYENPDIQRVYWTDRVNPLRSINIVDERLLSLPTSQLSLSPFINLSYPYAHKLTTGSLLSGQYQIVYRLSREGGAVGPISPISSPVAVTGDIIDSLGSNTAYEIYGQTNTDVPTDRGIVFRFDNIDTSFDVLDPYIIRRETGGLYRAFLAPRIRLGGRTEVDYELTDLNVLQEIGVEEVFDYDVDFDKVKTLTIKDNSLIVGNVKESTFELDFDVRAYRFKRNSTDSYINYDTNINNWGVRLDADAINPSNDVRTEDEDFDSNYFWQRNNSILGGEGPNVKYSFVDYEVTLNDVAGYNGGTKRPKEAPFSAVPPRDLTVFGPNEEVYEMNNSYDNHKDGIIQSLYKGYMRDEVYRFGVVFYSKTGKPSTVKWIGDIRMPQEATFDKVDTDASTEECKGKILGVKFEIDISDIKDEISGYKIVRAPRANKDKTIVGQGFINNIGIAGDVAGETDTIYCNSLRGSNFDTNKRGYTNDNFLPVAGASSSAKVLFGGAATFDCPDFKMGMTPIDEGAGNYYIKPVAAMQQPNISSGAAISITEGDATTTYDSWYSHNTQYFRKVPWNHGHLFTPGHNNFWGEVTNLIKVGEGKRVQFAAPGSADTLTFLNRGFLIGWIDGDLHGGTSEDLSLADDILLSPGTDTIILSFNNVDANKYIHGAAFQRVFSEWRTYDYVQNIAYRQIIANLCRPLDKQYGGNTYEERKDTEYISCSGFMSVERFEELTYILGSPAFINVYGGDCFIGLTPMKKLFSENATHTIDATGESTGDPYTDFSFTVQSPVAGFIIPVEGQGNVEMKNGPSLNTLFTITDTELNDGWIIDPVYNIERYFQKFPAEGGTTSTSTEFDNRVYKSQPKTNGELFDSWSTFKPFDSLDLDGHNGPINKLETFNDRLFFFQDSGVGEISVNPREVIPSVDGGQLELGTGTGLVDYKYLSETIGSKHQFSVLKSKIGLYFFDANLRKYYRLSNGLEPLSDSKAMSSWFYKNTAGELLSQDNPFFFSGISTGYDNRYNEVYITLKNRVIELENTTEINDWVFDDTTNNSMDFIVPDGTNGNYNDVYLNKGYLYLQLIPRYSIWDNDLDRYITEADIQQAIEDNDNILQIKDISYTTDSNGNPRFIDINGSGAYTDVKVAYFQTLPQAQGSGGSVGPKLVAVIPITELPNIKTYLDYARTVKEGSQLTIRGVHATIVRQNTSTTINVLSDNSNTIVFNETINAFTGFYSHTPDHYIMDGRKIITQDPSGTALYIHDEGDYGEFYGVKHPSRLTLLVNPPGDTTKVFNNVEYLSQVDINGTQEHSDTLNSIRVYNEYQDTGIISLIPDNNVKRRMRTWRLQVPRNGNENARIRNPYVSYDFEYTNVDDKHLVLNDVTSYYIDSPY